MCKLDAIADGYDVYKASIIDLDIWTEDRDEQGLPQNTGGNRSLSAGITLDGDLLIYVHTNGDPCLIEDDIDEAEAVCLDMGDVGDADQDRIETGIARIRHACDELDKIYHNNEAALECIDWYRAKMDEVERNNI